MKETLLDWLGSFWKVLVVPTPQTFIKEAKKADGKFPSAVGWLIFYAVYFFIINGILTGGVLDIPTLLTLIFLIPPTVILLVSVLNFICQRIFYKKKYIYDKLLYITVSIFVPIFMIFVPLQIFIAPEISHILGFILLLYPVALLTIAVKAIAEIEYWQAFVATVFSIIAAIVAGFIVYLLIVSTISPPSLRQTK